MHGLGVTAMTARCKVGKLQVTNRSRQQHGLAAELQTRATVAAIAWSTAHETIHVVDGGDASLRELCA
jgi:hypothetical protein